MSLINQMLRDLEARQAKSSTDATDEKTPLRINPAPTPKRRMVYATAVIVLLGFGTGAGWFLGGGNKNPSIHTSAADQPRRMPAPDPARKRTVPEEPSAILTQATSGSAIVTSPKKISPAIAPNTMPALKDSTVMSITSEPSTQEIQSSVDKSTLRPPLQPPALQTTVAPTVKPEETGRATITASGANTRGWNAELNRILKRARQHYNNKDFDGVITLLRPHLNADNIALKSSLEAKTAPSIELSAQLYQQMALAQLQLQRHAAARATLKQGHLVAPTDVELHMLYARVLLEQGEIEHAYAMLRELPQPQISANPDFYALRAAFARQKGAYTEATELYALLCQLQPSRGDWRLGLAISQHQLGTLEQAGENYRRAATNLQLNEKLRTYATRQAQLLTP